MVDITEEEAINKVRSRLGISESTPGKAWQVRRLDRPDEPYYLVEIGGPTHTVGIGIVDIRTGEVGISANLPGGTSHITVDRTLAKELAGGGDSTQAELTWMPSRASKSPLYPLWEVKTQGGIKYVDQQKRVFNSLDAYRLGG